MIFNLYVNGLESNLNGIQTDSIRIEDISINSLLHRWYYKCILLSSTQSEWERSLNVFMLEKSKVKTCNLNGKNNLKVLK